MNIFDLKDLVEERIGDLEYRLRRAIREKNKWDIPNIEEVLQSNRELSAALDHSIETGGRLRWITKVEKLRRDNEAQKKIEEFQRDLRPTRAAFN